MKKVALIAAGVAALVLIAGLALTIHQKNTDNSHGKVLHVVAAENFWGSLVSQIGGSKVSVTSIVTDPNADPHEFASTTATGRAYELADYVVENGVGYDSWSDGLLKAHQNPGRKVLKIADLVGKKEGDNPHLWYSPAYVNTAVAQMERDLIVLDPTDKAYFEQQYAQLKASLSVYQNHIADIKRQHSGEQVAATEDIFQYLADAAGLNLVSPLAFTEAIAAGNEPPAASVVQFQQQLKSGRVKVLVYNVQTPAKITQDMEGLAKQQNIPIVGISETVQPPNARFQDWMNTEVVNLQDALQK